MLKDLKHQLHNALSCTVSPDYGLYISDDKLLPKVFKKFPNSNKGILIVIYGNGLSHTQRNEYLVICINREDHHIHICNTQGKLLNCQAYERLLDIKHENKFFKCTQYRYKCEKNDLLMNTALMYFLVHMFSYNIKIDYLPQDNDIIDTYYSYIPSGILHLNDSPQHDPMPVYDQLPLWICYAASISIASWYKAQHPHNQVARKSLHGSDGIPFCSRIRFLKPIWTRQAQLPGVPMNGNNHIGAHNKE